MKSFNQILRSPPAHLAPPPLHFPIPNESISVCDELPHPSYLAGTALSVKPRVDHGSVCVICCIVVMHSHLPLPLLHVAWAGGEAGRQADREVMEWAGGTGGNRRVWDLRIEFAPGRGVMVSVADRQPLLTP